MATTTALRPLRTHIITAVDAEIVQAGSADLVVGWHGAYRYIGRVEQITADGNGEVLGTLVFNDDHISQMAQEMYQTNDLEPNLSHSNLGVLIIY